MQSTAQGWLVYSLTKSPFYLGVVSAVGSLPVMLFSLLGGVVADRLEKRRLLICTQALLMVPAMTIGVLTATGAIRIWHVMIIAGTMGIVNAFDMPARQSFLIEMVERGNLLNAVALNSAAFNAGRIIGPFLAGMTIAYLGLSACFYLNAASFVPVIAALYVIKARSTVRPAAQSVLRDFLEGFRFVLSEPDVMRAMLVVAAFSLFGIPFITMLPVYAAEVFSVGPKGLGFLASAAGLGAFTSAVVLAFKGEVRAKERIRRAAEIAFPTALLVFSHSEVFAFSLIMLFVCGLSVVAFLAITNSSIQLKTPDALRGRVMSVYTFVFLGLAPVGNFLMGTAANAIGTENAVLVFSALCLCAAVFIPVHYRRRTG